MGVEQLPFFAALSDDDKAELRRFDAYLRRRAAKPDEPHFHAYAEVYGETVFEDAEALAAAQKEEERG